MKLISELMETESCLALDQIFLITLRLTLKRKLVRIKSSFLSQRKTIYEFHINFLVLFSEDSYASNTIQGIDIKTVYIGLPVSIFLYSVFTNLK